MSASRRLFIFLVALLLVGSLHSRVAKAQGPGGWSPDQQVPGYLDDTFTPLLVSDSHGVVHAFASQWVVNVYRRQAVVYRQWTPWGGWTRPVDIILAPSGDAQILSAFLDASDRMHLIFMAAEAGKSGVYYSIVPVEEADLAMAWSVPVLIGSGINLNSAVILGDDRDHLFVIYSGNRSGNGVYFLESADSGSSWSDPEPVYLTYDVKLVAYSLRLAISNNEQLRAAWNVVTSVGVDELLYFANYEISSSKWDIPVELDSRLDLRDYFGPSFPAMTDNGNEIVIVYNTGNPFHDRPVDPGRPIQIVRFSRDNGKTWSSPFNPFPFHLGRSGEHALVLDSSGASHCLFVQRTERIASDGTYRATGGLWHSTFKDGQWSNPDRFVPTYTPHDVRAVISQGNVLLAVWQEDPGIGEHGIWFSYRILDTPALPTVPVSIAPASTPAPGQAATITPSLNTPTSLPDDLLLDSRTPQWMNSPAFPVIAGVTPVLLLVVSALLAYRYIHGRRE